jgi:short-subunit dehydrogenase
LRRWSPIIYQKLATLGGNFFRIEWIFFVALYNFRHLELNPLPRRLLNESQALVTGASSGIGREIALQLATAGAHVLAVARRQNRLDDLVTEFHSRRDSQPKSKTGANDKAGSITPISGDLTIESDRKRWADWCQTNWGGLDILVNNAGSGAIGRFDTSSPERVRKLMEVDFFGPVELTRVCLPLLKQRSKSNRPVIVMVGSVLAHRAVPLKSEYCAAKFALRGWAESLRCELAGERIEVLQIDPSTTRSEFFDSLIDTPTGAKSESIGSMSPQRVATLTIRAIERSKRRMVLSVGGRLLVSASRWFPGIVDRILSR